MAFPRANILVLTFMSLFIAPSFCSSIKPSSIKEWCAKTGNSQSCETLFSLDPTFNQYTVKDNNDFFQISNTLALTRAVQSHANLLTLGPKCKNQFEEAAWRDCVELSDFAVQNIKLTSDPSLKPSAADSQIWLSSAMTYQETCKQGFEDFGLDYSLFNTMDYNVTTSLSNALSINKIDYTEPETDKGFPVWVKPGDRKLLQAAAPTANVVVAQDGSGNYKTIGEAVAAAAKRIGTDRYVIYIKAGTYRENIDLGKGLKNIMFVGDGIGKTIITGSRSVGGGSTTFGSATVAANGAGFMARGITIRNTAGPQNHQAVAFRSDSDLSVMYQCSFEGYQDTLYVHSMRQFYRECDIYGTVDFIFGNGAVVLQNCNIYPRSAPNRTNTLTAQGRTDPNEPTGISIHNCRVTAASDLKPVQASVTTYLGRPWKQYSRTVFMKTFLDDLITPVGWMPWAGTFALNTLYYAEYANTGPGSSTVRRVTWKGYHVLTNPADAAKFTPGSFIAGSTWLPATGVPFTAGL